MLTCRRGGGVNNFTIIEKKNYKKKQHTKNTTSIWRIEPGSPGPKASVLSTELFRLGTTLGRKSLYLQTAALRDMSSECMFAWNETRMTWRHDVYKAGNETCFQINCLLVEVTHLILWSNRYDRVDKYPLYWIPGCRYAVQWFNCRRGLLGHDTWRCRGFFTFSWTKSLWP